MKQSAVLVIVGGLAASAFAEEAHNAFIWIEGPEEVLEAGTTYTLEVWGRFESPLWTDESAMAGFGIGVDNFAGEGNIALVENINIEDWAEPFGFIGDVVGTDILQVSGGQLAQIFCCHQVDRSNPIRLFTFEVMMGEEVSGRVSFAPAWPHPAAGLSFYPDSEDGASVLAPNDPDTALHLAGWSSTIPSPAGAVVLGLVLTGRGRRRR